MVAWEWNHLKSGVGIGRESSLCESAPPRGSSGVCSGGGIWIVFSHSEGPYMAQERQAIAASPLRV